MKDSVVLWLDITTSQKVCNINMLRGDDLGFENMIVVEVLSPQSVS